MSFYPVSIISLGKSGRVFAALWENFFNLYINFDASPCPGFFRSFDRCLGDAILCVYGIGKHQLSLISILENAGSHFPFNCAFCFLLSIHNFPQSHYTIFSLLSEEKTATTVFYAFGQILAIAYRFKFVFLECLSVLDRFESIFGLWPLREGAFYKIEHLLIWLLTFILGYTCVYIYSRH